MNNYTTYKGKVGLDGPSPAIWFDCPILEMLLDPSLGFFVWQDFIQVPTFASATEEDGFLTYQDTGVTIKGLTTEVGGVLEIAGADADNDEGSIQDGSGQHGYVKFSSSAPRQLWFEARVRVSTAIGVEQGLFVGLAEEATPANSLLVDDTGALASKDFVGFHAPCAAAEIELDCVYRKAGQAAVTVKDEALIVTVNTWYKLGFRFDPNDRDKYAFRFFVDGVEVSGASVLLSAIDDATFPDGEELATLFAMKAGEAVEKKFQVDWYRVAQLRIAV